MIAPNYALDSEKRKQQIDTLKIFNDNVTETQENTEYRVDFFTGGNDMYIDVILGPEFPFEKPLLMIKPPIQHPWVADDMTTIIRAPGLLNYSIHSDLGRVVQAIIREFEQKPPKILDQGLSQINEDISNVPPNVRTMSPPFIGNSPLKNLMFPGLQNLSKDELESMLRDDNLLDKFIETVPQYSEMNKVMEDFMEQIESSASENLSKKTALDNLKTDIADKLNTLSELKNNYESLKTKHSKLCSKYTPQAIKATLIGSTKSAEEDAEVLAQTFLDGVIDCDTFLKKYEIKRSLGHSRKACLEILTHQLLQLDRAT